MQVTWSELEIWFNLLCFCYRRNFNHKKEYTYSTLHWHHNAVNTLCFTPEGGWCWVYFTLFSSSAVLNVLSPSEKTWLLLSLQAVICWAEALSRFLSSGSVGQAAKKMSCLVSEDPFYMYLHHLMDSCFVSPIQTTVSLQLWGESCKFHSKRFKEYCDIEYWGGGGVYGKHSAKREQKTRRFCSN